MATSYVAVFAAYTWYFAIGDFDDASYYLYYWLIIITCGSYAVGELAYVVRNRLWRSTGWLMVAGVSGAIGLYGMVSPSLVWCELIPLWNGETFWFLLR
jgi:hypothetical protein